MKTPTEPLLPVEPDAPSRLKLWVLLGAAGAALAATAVVVLLIRGGGAPPPAEAPAPAAGERPAARVIANGRPTAAPESADAAEERRAKELYDAAEAFERAEPGDHERRAARWREIVTAHPTSPWGRRADEKHRAATAALQAFLDREFESTRRDAQALAAAGHFVDAIEAIQTFRTAQTREILKRRADVEIGALENACRLAFNEAAAKARELAVRRDYPAARALFEGLAPSAIPEVATRCREAVDQLAKAAAAQARLTDARQEEAARRAFREEIGPKLLALVRARQYDEALKELGSATSPALKEEVAAERAAIADASSYWESFLKALRGRAGQEATLLLSDGRRASGKIARVLPDRVAIDGPDGAVEVSLDKLHADLLVGWTIGRTLPAEDPVTYVKAGLFFFCEGRDELAKLYLATAKELHGPADAPEKVFRGGLLRAAAAIKK